MREATTADAAELRRRWRATVLPTLRGAVLDLGAGSGIAADHLDATVEWLALEPARRIDRALGDRIEQRATSRLLRAAAERIPLADGAVDAVIASTVLCSVRRPDEALAEVRRVLRSDGRLVFFEHVAAPRGTWSSAVQTLYAPLSRLIDHGCDPHRDTESAIRAAGFTEVEIRRIDAPGALGMTDPIIEGVATR